MISIEVDRLDEIIGDIMHKGFSQYRRWSWIALAFFIVIYGQCRLASESPAIAQEQGPDPSPQKETQSIGEIQHLTQFTYPTPQTRTTIGVGEVVNCWIDATTWTGPKGDSLGSITWSVSGPGSVSPTTGSSTAFTAPILSSTYNSTVTAEITDSQNWCPPVQKRVNFAVQVPNGMTSTWQIDLSFNGAVLGPPNNQIGAVSLFNCYIQPNNVNFQNVNFRENMPAFQINWPDTTVDNFAAQVSAFNVLQGVAAGQNNWWSDQNSSSLNPIGRIANQNFSWTRLVPLEYQNVAGNWVGFFLNQKHIKSYTGATGKAIVAENGAVTKVAEGPWQ